MQPAVSVVITCWQYARYVDSALAALAEQTLGTQHIQIVFVDDGSTDASVLRAQAWRDRARWHSFHIEVLNHMGHPAPVRNAGLKLATAPHVLFHDVDDWLAPAFLEHTVATLQDHPEVAIAYTDYTEARPGTERRLHLPEWDVPLLRTQNLFHTTSLVRREACLAVRGFRATSLYEDWDFWLRLAAAGYTARHVPQPLFFYRIHDEGVTPRAVADDGKAKAAIVCGLPAFFPPAVVHWAKGLLHGEPWAPAFSRGIIPDVPALQQLTSLYAQRLGREQAETLTGTQLP